MHDEKDETDIGSSVGVLQVSVCATKEAAIMVHGSRFMVK